MSTSHLTRINKLFAFFLLAHIPFVMLTAWLFETGVVFGLTVGIAIAAGPIFLTLRGRSPFATSIAYGIASMGFSALLIHLAQGMIELHFHIFVLLAVLSLFGNPWVVLSATVAIAVHHLGFFFLIPKSVFNYEASLWIVLLHAVFVLIETGPVAYIAHLFGRFIQAQELLADSYAKSVENLEFASGSIAALSADQLSQMTAQAAAVQESSAAVAQIQSMVQQTVESSQESAKVAEDVSEKARVGVDTMRRLQESMEALAQASALLKRVTEAVQQIGERTEIIHSIVFKTEMLAFNASIEAARAGQYGKGFAVVAEEVGHLAGMSGKAAADISSLLQESRSTVEEIVGLVQRRSTEGATVSQEAVSMFELIANSITQIQSKVEKVSEATAEQRRGLEQTGTAIQDLDRSARSSQQNAQQLSEIVRELERQSAGLSDIHHQALALVGAEDKVQKGVIEEPENDSRDESGPEFMALH